jgi:hypothetical protein
MSETISPPRNEPGAAAVTQWPNEIELPEPGGVNWTTRKSSRNGVVVEPPPEPCVELLCTVDIRHGDERDLELHIDARYTGSIFLFSSAASCLTHVPLLGS